jgi:hypothetical protein
MEELINFGLIFLSPVVKSVGFIYASVGRCRLTVSNPC